MAQSGPARESCPDVEMAQLSLEANTDLSAVNVRNMNASQTKESARDSPNPPELCWGPTGEELSTGSTPIGPGVAHEDIDLAALNRRKDSDDYAMVTLEQFADSTTFHGIRYIVEKTPFSIRRLVSISFSVYVKL